MQAGPPLCCSHATKSGFLVSRPIYPGHKRIGAMHMIAGDGNFSMISFFHMQGKKVLTFHVNHLGSSSAIFILQ